MLVMGFLSCFFSRRKVSGILQSGRPLSAILDSPDPVRLPGPSWPKEAKEELLRGPLVSCAVSDLQEVQFFANKTAKTRAKRKRRAPSKTAQTHAEERKRMPRAIALLGTLVRREGDLRCRRRLAQSNRLDHAQVVVPFANISGAADLEISDLTRHLNLCRDRPSHNLTTAT